MPIHSIPPVYNEHSQILILGSFPSVRSREVGFFYGHPRNRFWQVLATILKEPLPINTDEKKALLLRRHIALWDVAASCEIQGSADSTLKNVVPNDISFILLQANIRQIFLNGNTAASYYRRLIEPSIQRPAIVLPSTSPANASWSPARLCEAWSLLLSYIEQ